MKQEEKRDIRLAMLIDADNISAHYIKPITAEAARYGTPTIKRIYGDWTRPNLASWKEVLIDYAITPVQQFSYTYGKNATDSAMIIDAMDILYGERVDGFCIVSSDSDFTRLAIRLREAGKIVYGFGEQKTPNAFIAACDRFIYIEILTDTELDPKETVSIQVHEEAADKGRTQSRNGRSQGRQQQAVKNGKSEPDKARGRVDDKAKDKKPAEDKAEDKREATRVQKGGNSRSKGRTIRRINDDTRQLVYDCTRDLADEDGWASLGDVGNLIAKVQPSFDSRNFGYAKLSHMIKDVRGVEMDSRPTGTPNVYHIYIRVSDDVLEN